MHTKSISAGYGKAKKWVVTPNPGPHRRGECIPLVLVIRDMLGYADNAAEAKKIIQSGKIMVDKKIRKDHKFGVGLMDVIDMPTIDKHYRVLPGPKGLEVREITKEDSEIKLCKITGKTTITGGKTQISMHDGSTINADGDYKTNDTLVITLAERKIKESIPYKAGSTALIAKGRHSGSSGKISDIIPGTATRKSITTVGDMQTLTAYAFVIGTDKPLIKL